MTDKNMILQNYTNSEEVVLGPYVQMYPASHGSNQALNIKAEEDSDLQEEVDPVPITDQEIKVKCENYTNSEDAVLGPYVQMYPESHGSNQVLNIKVEVSDPQEEVDPVPITVQEIKVKCENYTNSEDVVLGPYVQMYPESHGSNQVLNIKVEEDSDPQEEVDPVPITFQETKVKCEGQRNTRNHRLKLPSYELEP
ncbi:uncharacterized protein LOC111862093 isoform X2 [Cryptotermes secundus]|uniref:uncharacterized protein LOC111862093 isoform X2 n=1 Tax=Cryptotermes secundus TaxID=105785 RepID=UPI001454DB88|nr:uncharacterized protein LOC111862093 isoform X2 [Cryptotermes secundus]